jgi:hypothetical protein
LRNELFSSLKFGDINEIFFKQDESGRCSSNKFQDRENGFSLPPRRAKIFKPTGEFYDSFFPDSRRSFQTREFSKSFT